MENIRPSADLRNKYNEISTLCKETREPIYITVNGRGDTVILSIENFKQMQAELDLLKNLAEAEDDVRNNHLSLVEETFADLKKKLEA